MDSEARGMEATQKLYKRRFMSIERIPRIVYLGSDVRERVLAEHPEIEDMVSTTPGKDTLVHVGSDYTIPNVVQEDGANKGTIYVDELYFQEVLKGLRIFIDAYKSGMTLREAADMFVNRLGGEGATKWQ